MAASYKKQYCYTLCLTEKKHIKKLIASPHFFILRLKDEFNELFDPEFVSWWFNQLIKNRDCNWDQSYQKHGHATKKMISDLVIEKYEIGLQKKIAESSSKNRRAIDLALNNLEKDDNMFYSLISSN